MYSYTIKVDDLSGSATRELIALHMRGMRASSPPENVCGLDLDGLDQPDITVWSVWDGDSIAGIGALRSLDDGRGELKSMRTAPEYLRKGVAGALLEHILMEAHNRGLNQLSLETGSGEAFDAAISFYESYGFVEGGVFSDYESSDFNRFFHLQISGRTS